MANAQRVRTKRTWLDAVVTVLVLYTILASARSFFAVDTLFFKLFTAGWVVLGVVVLCLRWLPRRSRSNATSYSRL
jgi:uncharacterized membrane-anchored protein